MTDREKTIIERYGSLEEYSKLCRQWGSKGGKTSSSNTPKKGFGSNRELAAEMGLKTKKAKREDNNQG